MASDDNVFFDFHPQFCLVRILRQGKFFFATNLTKASTDSIIHPHLHNHLFFGEHLSLDVRQ